MDMKEEKEKNRRYRPGCLSLFCLILFILGTLVMPLGIMQSIRVSKVDTPAKAQITRISKQRSKNGISYKLELYYEVEGRAYHVIENTSSSKHWEGQEVNIYYNRKDPEYFYMGSYVENAKGTFLMLGCIGILMTLLGLIGMILPYYLFLRKSKGMENHEEDLIIKDNYLEWTYHRPFRTLRDTTVTLPMIGVIVFFGLVFAMMQGGMTFKNWLLQYGSILIFMPGLLIGLEIYSYIQHNGKHTMHYMIDKDILTYSVAMSNRTRLFHFSLRNVQSAEWNAEKEMYFMKGKGIKLKMYVKKENQPLIEEYLNKYII